MLDCKICMDGCNEPIVTLCGHVFCWECVYDWSETRQSPVVPCPFCAKEVDVHKVIPIYTSQEEHARRKEIPRRPQAQAPPFRAQDQPQNGFFNFQFNPLGFNVLFHANLGRNPPGAPVPAPAPANRPLNFFLALLPLLLFFLPLLVSLAENFLAGFFTLLASPFRRASRPGSVLEMLYNEEKSAAMETFLLFLMMSFVFAVIFLAEKHSRRRVVMVVFRNA